MTPDCEDFMTPDPPILTVPDLTSEQWLDAATRVRTVIATYHDDVLNEHRFNDLAAGVVRAVVGEAPTPPAPEWECDHLSTKLEMVVDEGRVWVAVSQVRHSEIDLSAAEARDMAAALITAAEFVERVGGGS